MFTGTPGSIVERTNAGGFRFYVHQSYRGGERRQSERYLAGPVGSPEADAAAAEYVAADDGRVETGRPLYEKGAHVAGANFDSIGVCLVGKAGLYTVAQVRAAVHLVRSLIQTHGLSWSAVFGHYQHPGAGKTCPDFQIDHFRSLLRSA